MSTKLKEYLEMDIYRYYGRKQRLCERLFKSLELKYILTFRKASLSSNKFISIFYKYRLWKLSRKTHIQISAKTQIGRGMYIGHLGRIIINPNTIIGDNVNLSTGVTIGQQSRGKKKGVPIIGNNVWIGTNAVIVGGIKVGNDVLIAPNAYVNNDIPDHSVVIGNPSVVHMSEYATENYIQNTV